MPLEIKELHIKVTVNQPAGAQPASSGAAGIVNKGDEKEELIGQCVDEIMQILSDKKER
jgi:hypothetical protein